MKGLVGRGRVENAAIELTTPGSQFGHSNHDTDAPIYIHMTLQGITCLLFYVFSS